ncbi:unnamed protein product [Thlaspi arvense]|uniref:Uncharacterized protein n=1 Tax=Thlaspi arvense TaxID=13288 RepID=A0AAU9T8R6_THLAR|nr:unnamed protein product [Thlaspi arvense]
MLDAEVTRPNIANFLRCLRDRTSTENPITEALYTPDNSTFVSSYVSYVKNKRELFLRAMPNITTEAKSGAKTIAVMFIAQFLGSSEKLIEIINNNLPELELKREDCYEMSWLNTTTFWADFPVGTPTSVLLKRPSDPPGAFFKSKSDYARAEYSSCSYNVIGFLVFQ